MPIIIIGDFNARIGNLNQDTLFFKFLQVSPQRISSNNTVNKNGKKNGKYYGRVSILSFKSSLYNSDSPGTLKFLSSILMVKV